MLKIIKSKDGIFLVQIDDDFYVVRHDPSVKRTYAVHRTDIIKGFEPRSAYGFTENAVKKVAKPRTMKTGRVYYAEVVRQKNRADEIKKICFTPEKHIEAGNMMQDAVN